MKLITVVILGALVTITSAIRVPTSWPNKQKLQETQIGKLRTTPRPVRSEIGLQTRPPHVVHAKVNSGRKHQQKPKTKVRHRNVNRPQVKKDFKASATANDWKPIFPAHMVQRDDEFFTGFEARLPQQVKREKSPLHKNYRDDKTHEPGSYETVEVKHVRKEKPSSDHEEPLEVPTRPVYPGEGQWAKKGKKHRPFISKHKFTRAESGDEEEEKPEGREVFEENEKLFEKKREDFREDIDEFPRKHKLGAYVEVEEEGDGDDDKEEFVPIRLYTQVRRSESEAHLPKLEEDPRLREVIKDSKIQTVYTEEGYEDIAYDHAGHEKLAEQDEGFSEFDREIEKEKQRRARKERVEDDSDSQTAGSRRQSVEKPFKSKKDNFVTIKEIKTTSLKDKVNGNSELEVLNEIKIMTTPENGTRAHRYVRIFPKMYTPPADMSSMESAIRKSVYRRGRRSKRFTNDFPQIKVDTDFIDKIKHDLPRLVQIRRKPKYPYYNDVSINPNSPLRYAEDLDNIPKKTQDPYAFYNQAEKIQCAEVETEVDPITARVKNADSDPENVEDATDVQELVKTPRLKGLGDKIDCFKVKYFGEDPLDSPIFKEKEIGPVLPIFGIFKARESGRSPPEAKPNEIDEENNKSYSIKVPVQQELKQEKNSVSPTDVKDEQLGFNILTDIIGQFNKSKGVETATTRTSLKLEIVRPKVVKEEKKEDTTQTAVISIITTPKYTIDLKPKHIYHQIELLEYLPQYNSSESVTDKNSIAEEVPQSQRRSKNIEEEEEEVTIAPAVTEEAAPETQALRKRRRRIRPHRPHYHIFDVNRYLPPSSYALLNKILRTSPTVPKRDALNQVEIKPNEQLNVFADVINNIKNSSKDPHQIAASSNRIAVKLNHLDPYRKHPRIRNVETDLDNIEQTNSFYLTTTTTTTAAPRGTVKYSSYKTMENLFEDMANRDKVNYENLELLRVKKRLTTTTEPYVSETRSSLGEEEEEEEEDAEDEEQEDTTSHVLGLMPPGPTRYKTIVAPKLMKSSSVETKMNHFYVLGMKPPSAKQKVYLYSDFKVPAHGKVKLAYLRRGKRSAQRPAYSEVVRNRNKPIDVEDDTEVVVEDDDDYVPHRPKNYHYDEKTGRIVYDDPPKGVEEPEEEYIEVTEAPLPKPTRRNSIQEAPKFKNFTGPSFVDFVKQLKSNPNYQPITDPPTTEKGEEGETTTTTTVKPVSTEPPPFLSILAKVRSDSSYKAIEDKTTAKTTTTTTTEAPEEETQLENVQNSPGGQSSGQNFQIFDITDYLPKVKSYSPRTSIDYSKYKTIERPSAQLRHNISSRYSSEEDSENVNLSTVEEKSQEPDRGEINPVMSESKHEDVEPSTTSSTTTEVAPTTTTSRRIRTRTKTRGRRPAQRSTTVAPVVTTSSSSVSSTEAVRVHHDKPRRSFPRRRPSRIKINRTTELPDSETEENTTPKVVRRRHQRIEDVPVNNAQERIDSTPPEVVNKTREVVSLNDTKNNESLSRSESRKVDDVQVFQQYDQVKKHGGNYKNENVESESKKVPEVKRLTDVVQKPATYYTDPKLPKKINQLMEVNVEEEVEESTEKEEEGGEGEYDYEESEEKSTTTKKPVFVKDPSKRLYYYAPV